MCYTQFCNPRCLLLKIINRSDFVEPEYEVRRRYSDFAWLRARLECEQPMHFLPVGSTWSNLDSHFITCSALFLQPLPEKHALYALDRFEASFVRTRCYLLNMFMRALLDVPKCVRQPDAQAFLTLDETVLCCVVTHFDAHRAQCASAGVACISPPCR